MHGDCLAWIADGRVGGQPGVESWWTDAHSGQHGRADDQEQRRR